MLRSRGSGQFGHVLLPGRWSAGRGPGTGQGATLADRNAAAIGAGPTFGIGAVPRGRSAGPSSTAPSSQARRPARPTRSTRRARRTSVRLTVVAEGHSNRAITDRRSRPRRPWRPSSHRPSRSSSSKRRRTRVGGSRRSSLYFGASPAGQARSTNALIVIPDRPSFCTNPAAGLAAIRGP
jgi:hypothetical protein